jgi:hypothetical protein
VLDFTCTLGVVFYNRGLPFRFRFAEGPPTTLGVNKESFPLGFDGVMLDQKNVYAIIGRPRVKDRISQVEWGRHTAPQLPRKGGVFPSSKPNAGAKLPADTFNLHYMTRIAGASQLERLFRGGNVSRIPSAILTRVTDANPRVFNS